MSRPTNIHILLVDGTPDGLKVVSKSNWTGKAIVCSRSQLGDALDRPELKQPGVYVLWGDGEGLGNRLYVGEADVLEKRLRSHERKKDFWTQMIAFTATDEGLNKAHVRYLEANLVALAKTANQWELENSQVPALPQLSESDEATAAWFLSEMLVIYPMLGIDAFEAASAVEPSDPSGEYVMEQRGVEARGREAKDGFIVLAGSKARPTPLASIRERTIAIREQLLERGVVELQDGRLVFLQDYRFTSPSAAAGVLIGGRINGRKAWRTEAGRTLKDIQDERGN